MSSIAESIALTALSFTGQLLRPTDHGHDARRVHNGLMTKYDPENFFRQNVNILPN